MSSRATLNAKISIADKYANRFLQEIANPPSPSGKSVERLMTIANMLRALHAFSGNLRDFFEHGFAGNRGYQLATSLDEPEAYVYERLASQVAIDMDGIVRAYSQRRIEEEAQSPSTPGQAIFGLQHADALGYQVLKPVIDTEQASPATILTYYRKSLGIRLIPYARVAFVGIPYSVSEYAEDFLAVAHELGHYVYRHSDFAGGANPKNRVRDYKNAGSTLPYPTWREEIFADVFGCLFAGPRIAKSFQELSAQVHSEWFNKDDGLHPNPILRPYIYIETLRLLEDSSRWGVDFSRVTQHLTDKWHEQPRHNGTITLPGDTSPISLTDATDRIAQDVIRPILDDFLGELVQALKPGGSYDDSLFRRWWGHVNEWNDMFQSGGSAPRSPKNIVLSAEEKRLPEVIEGQTPATHTIGHLDGGLPSSPVALILPPEEITFGKTKTFLDDKIDDLKGRSNVTAAEWLEILTFGGWIDKWPQGPHGHG